MERAKESKKGSSQKKGKRIYIACPVCNTHYKCKINIELVKAIDDGVARILMTAPCKHKFLAFIDNKGGFRGCERVDYEGTSIEIADAEFIKKHIAELEAKHKEILDSNYNEAFELMKEINKLKQDLAKFGQGIEVK